MDLEHLLSKGLMLMVVFTLLVPSVVYGWGAWGPRGPYSGGASSLMHPAKWATPQGMMTRELYKSAKEEKKQGAYLKKRKVDVRIKATQYYINAVQVKEPELNAVQVKEPELNAVQVKEPELNAGESNYIGGVKLAYIFLFMGGLFFIACAYLIQKTW